MTSRNSKSKAIILVNHILKEYFIIKKHSEEEADNQADVIYQNLCKEIWDINKKRITEELEDENKKKIATLEDELKKEYRKKGNMASFEKMMGLLFEGIFVAVLVGLGVNQITDLFSILKKSLLNSCKVQIWVSTTIIVTVILIILVCLIGKYFVDKIRELHNEINK